MIRRKGTPCACECNPCRGKNYVRAVNNVSPDPNGDLELKAGNGIAISQSGDNQITITNDATASSFVAGDNIEINPSGDNLEIRVTDDVSINNLNVAGDIIQQGATYETHAEKVYTTNDYIYMRDGAVGGLAVGSLSGFEVIKYDGTNNGRLAIDKDGTARVGDVGDEQPLLTREESANLNNGALLKWDGVNQKAIDEGTVGSDTKPIKIVNGIATAIRTDVVLSGGSSSYKWILKSGYTTMRFQSNVQHSVTINVGVTVADPNQLFPIVALAYNGTGWGTVALNVTSRSSTGFTVHSWIPNASGTDVTGDIFWLALIPVAP